LDVFAEGRLKVITPVVGAVIVIVNCAVALEE
jgi:hypothetical protein